jgi:hypothetical protein
MTKLKEFRETAPDWMKISMLDVLELIDSSKTNKFLPMLTQIVNNSYRTRTDNPHEIDDYRRELVQRVPSLKNKINTFGKGTLFTIYHMIEQIRVSELETMLDFMDSYEKNQINNVDINNLKNIQEIEKIVNLISVKNLIKEYSKQVSVELETEKWLVLRPLTYEASVKYGANTRWCTASKHNPNQFFRYTESSILVYCINKETGVKTAFHSWIDSQKKPYDISFWNSADDRIDSLFTDLDGEVIDVLKKTITSSKVTSNKEIGGEFWTKSYENNVREEKLSETPIRELIEPGEEQGVDYAMEPIPLGDGELIRNVNRRARITFDEPTNDQPDWSEYVEYGGG